jgi:AcrR family transcriptional regulator
LPRPSQSEARRKKLIPVIARTFAEFGYRRTTTAELARRCGVRENILYRLWPDKKAMFIATIDYVYELSDEVWAELLGDRRANSTSAERLLEYEAQHHGEFGLYRVIFAGLSETDDREISEALKRIYNLFHRFIARQIAAHRDQLGKSVELDPELAAWAFIGLGTVANIGLELRLLGGEARVRFIGEVGRQLLKTSS